MRYSQSEVDGFERDTFNEFTQNTRKYSKIITPLRGWSYDMIHNLLKFTTSIDFLFIDGDHNYAGVKKDWDIYSQLLHSNSIVVFHDTGWAEGVQKLINENLNSRIILHTKLSNMSIFKMVS